MGRRSSVPAPGLHVGLKSVQTSLEEDHHARLGLIQPAFIVQDGRHPWVKHPFNGG